MELDKKIKYQLKYLFSPRYEKLRRDSLHIETPESVLSKFINQEIQLNLLYIFWYEKRFNTEVFLNSNIIQNQIDLYTRNEDLKQAVQNKYYERIKGLSSDFSIFHYEYEKLFPNIEQFEFHQLFEWEFLEYMIGLDEYDSVGHYVRGVRFNEKQERLKRIVYEYGIPKIQFGIFQILQKHFNLNMHGISRELENEVRLEKGLPLIGEGWIGEAQLVKRVKEIFTDVEVISQGSPKWLQGQRFDIWIPSMNLAIEHHGIQHREAVDFFGGKEGFEATVRRDELKLKKSQENGVEVLVYWQDSDVEEFISSLKSRYLL